MYEIDAAAAAATSGIRDTHTTEEGPSTSGRPPDASGADGFSAGATLGGAGRAPLLRSMGSVRRQAGGHDRVAGLRFSEGGSLLACQGAGKSMELFRCGARGCGFFDWISQSARVAGVLVRDTVFRCAAFRKAGSGGHARHDS